MRGLWLLVGLLWAQMQDDFSDGDFTNNPTWSGTDAYWMVTSDYRLRSNGPSATATLYLSTANALIDNNEWRFWVRVAFNPSTQNFVRVYLVADRADLTDPALQGYYLLLGGISGSLDSLELWRQQGNSHIRLAGGIRGRFGSTNNILRVRVLRDAAGTWSVYTDSLGYWEQEFIVNDAVITSTSHFGVYFQHTSTNRQNLWFDDFYIGPPVVDTIPPQLLSVEASSPTLLRLTFSEAVDPLTAQNPGNYTLTPGSFTILSVVRVAPAVVELTLNTPLQPSFPYTLTFTGIQDMEGNVGSGSAVVVLPEVPLPGDIVLSEIMAKPTPAVGLPPYEYVELHNRSQKWLQVRNMRFCDASACGTLPARVIAPGEYLLLTPSSGVSAFSGLNPLAPSTWPILNDSGDSLTLISPDDEIMEVVQYHSAWYRDPAKAQGGWSLERIDLNDLCSADSNWIASQALAGGTPAAPNSVAGLWTDQTPPTLAGWEPLSPAELRLTFSEKLDTLAMQDQSRYLPGAGFSITAVAIFPQSIHITLSPPMQTGVTYALTIRPQDCNGNDTSITFSFGLPVPATPGDVIFSEIMAKPTPVVGLPPHEYVELYNRSQKWIALGGWQFCDASRCAVLPERMLAPGEYLILTSSSGAGALPQAVGLSSFPTLNDSGDSLYLRAPDGTLIAEVQYRSTWYRDPVKAQGGWSLERIDPDDLCNADSNWIASQAPAGGTPSAPNSVLGLWQDQTAPRLVSVGFLSAERILLRFSEAVDTLLMRSPLRYRIIGGPSVLSALVWTASEVEIILSAPLLLSTDYVLEIEATDCRGNTALLEYPFGLPSPAASFDVVITEIMADPDPPVGLPPYEYIELYNRSQKYLQLEGWRLRVGTSERRLPHYLLRPGHYVALSAPDGALALMPLASETVLGIPSFPVIPNRSGTITLSDSSGQVIEQLTYSDRWYDEPSKREGGWSLERIWTDWLCGGAANWRASTDPRGGTPASPNSVLSTEAPPATRILSAEYAPPGIVVRFSARLDTVALSDVSKYHWEPSLPLIAATPLEGGFAVELLPMIPLTESQTYTLTLRNVTDCAGAIIDSLSVRFTVPARPEPLDVVVNEILPEPQTGGVRYVELYNRSDRVIDVRQLLLARGAQPYSFREVGGEEPVLLFPGAYLCLTPDTEDVKRRYLPSPHARFYQLRSIPAYDYRRDTVWLLRLPDSAMIDRVPYAASYHFPDLRSRKGVALERLSPERPSDDPQNWYSAASVVGFGTPGYANSQREQDGPGNGIRVEPKTFSPDGDGYDDVLWVIIPVETPDVKAQITVHTLSGHIVYQLTEGELLAAGENRFRWEGTDANGRRLPAGIYIVNIVLSEPTRGRVQRYRLPCAIAERVR